MTLNDYMSSVGALTNRELAAAINCDAAQVRQWRSEESGRKPGAAYCAAIERATGGLVSRRDLRPDDWQAIWPELAEAA